MFIYIANDDLFMRAIISGGFTGTPEGHAICWILFIYRSIRLGSSKLLQIIFALMGTTFLVVLDIHELIFPQFTTLAGILAFTSLFWFVTEKNK